MHDLLTLLRRHPSLAWRVALLWAAALAMWSDLFTR
jgi:hypothetical protein